MESVAARFHESTQQLARQRNAFFSRTREASAAFLDEAGDAGRQLANAMTAEARRWRKFATQQSIQWRTGARVALSLPAVERAILAQVDGALKGLDAKVRARLHALETKPRKAGRTKARRAAPRARKSRHTLPAIAA